MGFCVHVHRATHVHHLFSGLYARCASPHCIVHFTISHFTTFLTPVRFAFFCGSAALKFHFAHGFLPRVPAAVLPLRFCSAVHTALGSPAAFLHVGRGSIHTRCLGFFGRYRTHSLHVYRSSRWFPRCTFTPVCRCLSSTAVVRMGSTPRAHTYTTPVTHTWCHVSPPTTRFTRYTVSCLPTLHYTHVATHRFTPPAPGLHHHIHHAGYAVLPPHVLHYAEHHAYVWNSPLQVPLLHHTQDYGSVPTTAHRTTVTWLRYVTTPHAHTSPTFPLHAHATPHTTVHTSSYTTFYTTGLHTLPFCRFPYVLPPSSHACCWLPPHCTHTTTRTHYILYCRTFTTRHCTLPGFPLLLVTLLLALRAFSVPHLATVPLVYLFLDYTVAHTALYLIPHLSCLPPYLYAFMLPGCTPSSFFTIFSPHCHLLFLVCPHGFTHTGHTARHRLVHSLPRFHTPYLVYHLRTVPIHVLVLGSGYRGLHTYAPPPQFTGYALQLPGCVRARFLPLPHLLVDTTHSRTPFAFSFCTFAGHTLFHIFRTALLPARLVHGTSRFSRFCRATLVAAAALPGYKRRWLPRHRSLPDYHYSGLPSLPHHQAGHTLPRLPQFTLPHLYRLSGPSHTPVHTYCAPAAHARRTHAICARVSYTAVHLRCHRLPSAPSGSTSRTPDVRFTAPSTFAVCEPPARTRTHIPAPPPMPGSGTRLRATRQPHHAYTTPRFSRIWFCTHLVCTLRAYTAGFYVASHLFGWVLYPLHCVSVLRFPCRPRFADRTAVHRFSFCLHAPPDIPRHYTLRLRTPGSRDRHVYGSGSVNFPHWFYTLPFVSGWFSSSVTPHIHGLLRHTRLPPHSSPTGLFTGCLYLNTLHTLRISFTPSPRFVYYRVSFPHYHTTPLPRLFSRTYLSLHVATTPPHTLAGLLDTFVPGRLRRFTPAFRQFNLPHFHTLPRFLHVTPPLPAFAPPRSFPVYTTLLRFTRFLLHHTPAGYTFPFYISHAVYIQTTSTWRTFYPTRTGSRLRFLLPFWLRLRYIRFAHPVLLHVLILRFFHVLNTAPTTLPPFGSPRTLLQFTFAHFAFACA